MPRQKHQQLPATGEAREALREKGQFWTPDWVADAMVMYVLQSGVNELFDPAVGAGAFFRAAKRWQQKEESSGKLSSVLPFTHEARLPELHLTGCELDPMTLSEATGTGLTEADVRLVEIRDFLRQPPLKLFPAIVANPPYIRHHRLNSETKQWLRSWSEEVLGKPLDGRTGLHTFFLLRLLLQLTPGGRLAVILPADVCEGVSSSFLWRWVTNRYCLEATATFKPQATPFPGVDTNPLIFFIRYVPPQNRIRWIQISHPGEALTKWVKQDFATDNTFGAVCRPCEEALQTGLSRPPRPNTLSQDGTISQESPFTGPVLGDFARVMRGIATGANEFFFLTQDQAKQWNLPEEFFFSAVGRTRDVDGDELTAETLQRLNQAGRPTWLLSPDSRPLEAFPPSLQDYLRRGIELGLPERSLIRQRSPWYKMERRLPPPFLFAYLGRRNTRFIRNVAQALPLTGFLCLYPRQNDTPFVSGLWSVLRHPETVAALSQVGKSYGEGAIKVELRALEQLPLSPKIVQSAGLTVSRLLLETSKAYTTNSEVSCA